MGRRSSTAGSIPDAVQQPDWQRQLNAWRAQQQSRHNASPELFVKHPEEDHSQAARAPLTVRVPLTRRAARAAAASAELNAQSHAPVTRRAALAAERAQMRAEPVEADAHTDPAHSEVDPQISEVGPQDPAPAPAAANVDESTESAPTQPQPHSAVAPPRPPVRLAPRAHHHAHEARHIDALTQRRSRRRMAATASAASIGLVSSLLFAVPANATARSVVAVEAHGHTASQVLAVSPWVSSHSVQHDSSVAAALAGIVASQDGVKSASAAAVIAAALQSGGSRQTIVETALSYLGDPYVLGGSDHTGIDCSGLTMQAYASIGIQLVHLVSAQDAVGVVIPESAARPGDLVVFDDNEHIGIYLGADLLIAAPEAGRPVTVEQVWSGIPHHFTRILPAGQ